jgi:hypothetical protein
VRLSSSRGSTPYDVTREDVLWLLRAVEAEGPDEMQVAATLLNGFLWARTRRNFRGSLAAWVRAYAQPVNPRWYATGDLHRRELERHPEHAAELAAKAARRERVHSTREDFSNVTQAAVAAALNGPHAIPRNATDYAAASLDATRKGYRPLAPPEDGRNRLWSRPGAFDWEGFVSDAAPLSGDSVWPWVACATLVAFAAWKAKGGKHG